MSEAWPGEGRMVNSGSFDGTATDISVAKVTAWLAGSGKGRRRVNYKLRDWGISRQRYWGTPIPIIHTADGEEPAELPVTLPDVEHYEPTDTGESPLAAIPEFVNTPRGKRETDTMGTFACSAWYYLRFADPHNSQAAFDKEQVAYWLPVDMYVGGAEHAVMHLLYARFWTKALYDLGYVPFVEPFKRLRNQGMILAPDGKEKMSKSKGNVITPDETVAEWGADALRAYEMFISDFEMATPWNANGLAGTHRWLRRAWDVILNPVPRPPVDGTTEQADRDLRRWTHKTLKKVSQDIEGFRFNTVISSLMEFTNTLFDAQRQPVSDAAFNEATDALLLMVVPIAPFMAEEIWAHKGRPYSVHQQTWPQFDVGLAADESITLVLQVNGKVRGRITMPVGLTEEQARGIALENEAVQRHLDGKAPRKLIYVPGKLVNVVV
jgi:leucyl-tRNA synthetase